MNTIPINLVLVIFSFKNKYEIIIDHIYVIEVNGNVIEYGKYLNTIIFNIAETRYSIPPKYKNGLNIMPFIVPALVHFLKKKPPNAPNIVPTISIK